MPYSHLNDYPADIRERAGRIRLVCFDVDGTLTDGHLGFDSEGREFKAFHVHDGMGLVMLRKSGIAVAFVTARASAVAEQRADELGVEAHTGVKDKLACVREIAARLGIGLDEVAFMGDDLPDLKVMPHVGLSAAPANAHPWTRERVHWRTCAAGGHGAAREFCDLLLAAQGHAETLLNDLTGAGGDGTRA
ncbi:KdsC family phosphatase [Marilutibacter maris]|uniref:3-deoxy-D-manno-octulosonate 8-phosphate phosphatase KdsC n=1 Tax=Marilutibacter maris TaxID=1605891 RepID=A0A2U9T7S4_9GAMM|nr:HAD hydrolase family protein [Lysobacter maris]AWV06558.1 3-deoxy-D-manno-octulosonate 8-phosphate phosphatase [Lysobacter maris]